MKSKWIIIIAYLNEKFVYSSFILFWLSIKVDSQLLPWATVSMAAMVSVLIFVTFNEVIKERLEDLTKELYDQPWYELRPAERRMLVPLMVDLQRSIGISTGLEDISLEWYARIAKAAYSMGLVLEGLVVK